MTHLTPDIIKEGRSPGVKLSTTNWTLPTGTGMKKFVILNPSTGNRFFHLFKP